METVETMTGSFNYCDGEEMSDSHETSKSLPRCYLTFLSIALARAPYQLGIFKAGARLPYFKKVRAHFSCTSAEDKSMAIRYRRWRNDAEQNGGGLHAPHISFVHQSGQVQIELKKRIQGDFDRTLVLTSNEFFDISFESNDIRQAGTEIAKYGTPGVKVQLPQSFRRLQLIRVQAMNRKAEHMYQWKVNENLRVSVRNRRSDGRRPKDADFVVEVRRFNQVRLPTDDGIMMAWHKFEGTFVHYRQERRNRIQEMEQLIRFAPEPQSLSENVNLPTSKKGDNDNEESSNTCVICFDKFSKGEQITGLPRCIHKFHGNCIQTWLKGSDHCPLCRAKVN